MNTPIHRWSRVAMISAVLAVGLLGSGARGAAYSSATYSSGFANSGAIPDGGLDGWSDTRTITGAGVHHVSDVRVSLVIAGGYNGDLYAYLVHGNGLAVLLNRPGLASTNAFGYADTGLALTLSAAGAHNAHFYQAYSPTLDADGRLTGTWQPDARNIDPLSAEASFDSLSVGTTANFSAFSGINPNGDWTLFIADVSAGGGQATVVSWGLEVDTVVEPPSQLAIVSVNGGASPTAGGNFNVVVEARDVNGAAATVSADTTIVLAVSTGSGTLGGTLTGTLSAGSSSLTFSNVTYSAAESGITLGVARTSGDALASADSTAFSVAAGAFAKLQVLMPGETAAPGSATGKTGTPTAQSVGTAFSVVVRAVDANWNLVTGVSDVVSLGSTDGAAGLAGAAALSGSSGSFNVTFFTAGSQTVTASDSTQPSIAANTGSTTTVDPGDQTITFGSPGDQTYQTATIALSASASSGLAVTFSVTSGPASVSGTTLTLTGAGSVTLRAAQGGNANWNAATPVDRTIDVAPKSVTPTFTAGDKMYDRTLAATIATRSLTGVIGNDDVGLAGGSATFATAAKGSGKTVTATGFTLSGTDAGNYVLASTTATTTADITAAPVSIASGLAADNKVYDGNATGTLTKGSLVLSGVVPADLDLVDVSTNGYSATFDSAAVGTGKTVTVTGLTLTGSAAGNYALSQPTLTANIVAGTVAQLVFATQPGGAVAGAVFGQQPSLRTQDAYGNDSTSGLGAHLDVTVALDSGAGPLQGTTALDIGTAAGNGTITFANLRIDARGAKVLRASASGLTDAVSSSFTVANVTPVAGLVDLSRPRNVTLKVRIADLLSQVTDANSDVLTLVGVSGTSTNGALLRTNATYVLYGLPPGGNVADSFSFVVSDGLQTATGTVRVSIQSEASGQTANLVSFTVDGSGHPTIAFAGIPGYRYRVQRTQDLTGIPVWTDLTTVVAPIAGLFQHVDTNPPGGSAYYRAIND